MSNYLSPGDAWKRNSARSVCRSDLWCQLDSESTSRRETLHSALARLPTYVSERKKTLKTDFLLWHARVIGQCSSFSHLESSTPLKRATAACSLPMADPTETPSPEADVSRPRIAVCSYAASWALEATADLASADSRPNSSSMSRRALAATRPSHTLRWLRTSSPDVAARESRVDQHREERERTVSKSWDLQ